MLSSAAGLLTDQSFLSVFCAAMLTIGIGWGLRKKNILKAESRPVLNALLLKLTVPCLAFDAFMTDFARGELRRNVQILLISFALYLSMIALSQLSRATEMRGGSKRPQLSDLRESGAIEQDADIVAFIHRPEYYGINQDENGMPTAGMAEIILAKHRNGAVCDVNLRFLKEQARFADVDDTMLPPSQAADSQQAYDDYASGSNAVPGAGIGGGLGAGIGGGEFDPNPPALNDEAPF